MRCSKSAVQEFITFWITFSFLFLVKATGGEVIGHKLHAQHCSASQMRQRGEVFDWGGDRASCQSSPPALSPESLGLQAVGGWSSDFWARPQTASSSQTDSGSLSLGHNAHGFPHCHFTSVSSADCSFCSIVFICFRSWTNTWLHRHTCLGIRPVHWLCWLTAAVWKPFQNLPLSLTPSSSHSAPHCSDSRWDSLE